MDRNALTEQRRQTVIGLLKGMNIKKSSEGGFDKEDVYDCMQQLCDLYEKNIEDLENTYETEIASLKDKYQKYDDNNELYISLIMEAKKSSNDIINQAKNEVELILNEGKEEVAKQEQTIEQLRAEMEAEKAGMHEEINAARRAAEAEKAAMAAELQAEKQKLGAMQSKYQQQISAMEAEFMEIKTNILRTAGKLDSLKSQLAETDEINWNVIDDAGIVDFPTEDISVENTFPVSKSNPTEELFVGEISDKFMETAAESSAQDFEGFATDVKPETAAETQTAYEPLAEQASKPDFEEHEDVQEVTLEDLMSDIEIDLPDIREPEAGSEKAADEQTDEISFEGLEELFKED